MLFRSMVVGRFTLDAVNHILVVQFSLVQRADSTVLFNEPRGAGATFEIARLPGVLKAEPFRAVPAWLRHDHFAKRLEITGFTPEMDLRQLVGQDQRSVALPPEGLLLGKKVAQILAVAPGDVLRVEVLEGARETFSVPVAATIDETLGLGAYMDARALARLLDEDRSISGAHLRLDSGLATETWARLKRMPAVGGVAVSSAMQQSVRDALDRSFTAVTDILIAFACVIVAGMVYNNVRIALSERGNELASLRVLGFTQHEVGVLLLGEQGFLTVLAIPLGLLIGYGLCALLVPAFDREMFRLPLVVGRWTLLGPALTALLASAASGLLVARRLRHLDLIAVLKTRE